MVVEELELGRCPYCKSTSYDVTETNYYDEGKPYVCADCYCNECKESFIEYYGIDEVNFDEDGDLCIYTNSLSDEEKKTLLKAINLLIEEKGDTKDYTRIIKVLNGELNRE